MRPDIGYLLNRATRHARLRLAARLADLELRPQQGAVLMAIAQSEEGRLTPRQIAEAIDTDAPTTSGLLERLQRDGWVRSEPNPHDGRSRLIFLAEKGQAVMPSVIEAAHSVSHEVTSGMTSREVLLLGQLLDRMVATPQPNPIPQKGPR